MTPSNGRWHPVTRREPCPCCGHADWCAWSPDGKALRCMREGDTPYGMRVRKPDKGGGTLYWRDEPASPAHGNSRPEKARRRPSASSALVDLAALQSRFAGALSPGKRAHLAGSLGVPPEALDALGCGWATCDDLRALRASGAGWREAYPAGAYTFPERDASGKVVGFSFRATDGRKGSPSSKCGARRGLIVPATLGDGRDRGPVLVVEGASDVAACVTLGLAAVGRPNNSGGATDLASLLRARPAIVLGEHDAKPDGSWPGREGALKVAAGLAGEWRCPVRWALPPGEAKDIRGWLAGRVAAGLDLTNREACCAAGGDLLAALDAAAEEMKPEADTDGDDGERASRPSASELLVRLAHHRYRVGQSLAGEPFAVPRDGLNIASMLRGGGNALRAKLASEFRAACGRVPNQAALADALNVLEGDALNATPEPLALRVAEHGGGIVLDLGTASGEAVSITPDGWQVVPRSPVLFRRTALTAAMPTPERGGTLDELRGVLNVADETWPLLRAWLVAAMLPAMPHPILLLGGQQGTGKSTAARVLLGLIDASTVPLRCEPRDPKAWAVSAAGSWAFAVDNVSHIAPWWSDALCRVVSGDGWIDRRLYTDGDLAVLSFRRVVVLTSIDAGAMRGDLADRLLAAELLPFGDDERRTEAALESAANAMRPGVLGALLDLVAGVLRRMPHVAVERLPRMADFGRVLAALDDLDGRAGDSLALYMAQRERLAGDVVESDPVALAIVAMVGHGEWSGTAGDLLAAITPNSEKPRRGWPETSRSLAGRLRRLAPALKALGYTIDFGERDTSRTRHRLLTVRYAGRETAGATVRPSDVPAESRPADDADGLDGRIHAFSDCASTDGTWGEV